MIQYKNEFRVWLLESRLSKRYVSNIISRLNRLIVELAIDDVLESFQKDKFDTILEQFELKEETSVLMSTSSLPYGKYELNNYKTALKKYRKFLETKLNSKSF